MRSYDVACAPGETQRRDFERESLPFQPFQSEFVDHRVVVIPADLDDDRRARFVSKLSAAVKQQAGLAAKCDAVLRVSGEIREDGDRILIPHEPAMPGNPAAIESESESPDIDAIWWLSWSVVRALEAAAPGTPHGGIQIAALYQDEQGRVKLGDFGIAPVFEAVCGSESRRQLHCDGRGWSLLGEDETRETGWIAPYFAHELFEGTPRLNPKADQFAAGTLLYLLGIGSHPYGANLSDPTLMLYFHLEPYAVADERPEWAEIFERAERDYSTEADKPILGWSAFIQKLLASDPGERFANPAEAAAAVSEFCPPAWVEATGALAAGLKRLDAGDVETLLKKVAPWKADESLPALWRGQLSRWLTGIEARKQEIGAYKQLEQRLAEGQAALNNVEVERAREIAREVLASPRCDDALRAAAEELVEFCDEQEQFIKSGADDLAKTYLETAGECLERKDFDHAREILNGLLKDSATPSTRAGQARGLLAEVELAEQRIEQQQAELAGAGEDLRAGRYDAARQRLEALLKEESLPEQAAAQARALLDEVAEARARRAGYVAALEAARSAWERADLDTLEERLSEVPGDLSDPEIADVRADLASRCEPLRTALELREAVKDALGANDAEAGLVRAGRARELGEIPQILHDELDGLVGQCQSHIDELEQVRIEQVLGFFQAAREACEGLRVEECRQRLKKEVLPQVGLPEDISRKAEELLKTCERIERAQTLFEYAREHLADRDFDEALALLDGLKSEGLPAVLVEQREALREEVARAREEYVRQERQRLAARLDEIKSGIEAGELGQADSMLKSVEASRSLTEELRERAAAARSSIEKQRPILEAIQAADRALAGDLSELTEALAGLERLPAELPHWAPGRIEAVKKQADEAVERRRRERIARATAALDAAEAALDGGDVSSGRDHLDEARDGIEFESGLAERHQRLSALAGQLDEWMSKVKGVSETVERGDFAAAQRELADLPQGEAIPELCRVQLVELKTRVEERVAERRAELDAELVSLEAELAERGRRARKFRQRIEALKAEALATDHHRAEAAELLGQWGRMAEPKCPKTPLVIAASIVAVVVLAACLYFGGVFEGGEEEKSVVPAFANAATPAREDETGLSTEVIEEDHDVVVETPTEPALEESPVVAEAVDEQISSPELEPELEPEPEPEPEPAKPTVEEVGEEYLAELRRVLPAALSADLLSGKAGMFEVAAAWEGRDLLPFRGPRFAEEAGRFEPVVGEVAEHFRLQIAALAALGGPVEVGIALGDSDVVTLRVVSPAEGLGITRVDLQARSVRVEWTARLDNDPRSEAEFAFSADFVAGEFVVDESTRSAFAVYLGDLQMDRLRESVRGIARELKLPRGVRLTWPGDFAGGSRVALSVRGAGERTFAELDARWNAGALKYEIDAGKAVAALRAGVRSAATRDVPAAAWPEIRAELMLTIDERRGEYFERCELLQVTLRDEQPDEPLSVAVELTVGPAGADERIVFPGRLAVREGVLAWDPSGIEDAKAAIVAQLGALALSLEDRLARMASSPTVEIGAFRDVLAEVTQAKIERYGTSGYELANGFAGEADGLIAVSAGLQRLTAPNAERDAFAVVFIEYFVSESDVYALGWRAMTNGVDAITGVSDAKVWRVMSAARLRGYAGPAAFRRDYSTDAELGERLLGRAFGDVLEGSSGGSFGVVVAPDGPLWLTRWEQVRFEPREVRNVDSRGTPRLERVATLREVLRAAPLSRQGFGWRRSGLWCVPALAGQWHGSADDIEEFELGELAPGKKPGVARFKQRGALTFATITDPTLAGDFGWARFAGDVRLEEIGHLFWDRRWDDERWNPTPFTSFALLQVP